MSRAARAQRIGRPGRPTLPPQSPKPRALVPPASSPCSRSLFIGARAVRHQRDVPAVPGRGRAGRRRRRSRSPRAPTRAASASCSRRKGVIDDARFFELNATVTLRRGKLMHRQLRPAPQHDQRRGDRRADAGPGGRASSRRSTSTIPEGLSRREVGAGDRRERHRGRLPARRPALDAALAPRAQLGAPQRHRTLEGFLFPATYELKAGATARDLVDRQLEAFDDNFGAIDLKARAGARTSTRYDVLTIASMIERETPLATRSARSIAAVIYNRLKQRRCRSASTRRSATPRTTGAAAASSPSCDSDSPYNTRHQRAACRRRRSATPAWRRCGRPRTRRTPTTCYYVVKPAATARTPSRETDAELERNVAAYERARARRTAARPPQQKC